MTAHEERSTEPSAPAAKANPEKFFMSLFQDKKKAIVFWLLCKSKKSITHNTIAYEDRTKKAN